MTETATDPNAYDAWFRFLTDIAPPGIKLRQEFPGGFLTLVHADPVGRSRTDPSAPTFFEDVVGRRWHDLDKRAGAPRLSNVPEPHAWADVYGIALDLAAHLYAARAPRVLCRGALLFAAYARRRAT